MRLREIKKMLPDIFNYRNKKYTMINYSMTATHKGKISDEIIWESDDKTIYITYDKGYIYAENDKGEVFAEVQE